MKNFTTRIFLEQIYCQFLPVLQRTNANMIFPEKFSNSKNTDKNKQRKNPGQIMLMDIDTKVFNENTW